MVWLRYCLMALSILVIGANTQTSSTAELNQLWSVSKRNLTRLLSSARNSIVFVRPNGSPYNTTSVTIRREFLDHNEHSRDSECEIKSPLTSSPTSDKFKVNVHPPFILDDDRSILSWRILEHESSNLPKISKTIFHLVDLSTCEVQIMDYPYPQSKEIGIKTELHVAFRNSSSTNKDFFVNVYNFEGQLLTTKQLKSPDLMTDLFICGLIPNEHGGYFIITDSCEGRAEHYYYVDSENVKTLNLEFHPSQLADSELFYSESTNSAGILHVYKNSCSASNIQFLRINETMGVLSEFKNVTLNYRPRAMFDVQSKSELILAGFSGRVWGNRCGSEDNAADIGHITESLIVSKLNAKNGNLLAQAEEKVDCKNAFVVSKPIEQINDNVYQITYLCGPGHLGDDINAPVELKAFRYKFTFS